VPPQKPDDFDIDVQLTRFFRRARTRTMRNLSRIDPALDYGAYLVLMMVFDAPDGVRASELAEAFAVHKSTISRAVSQLERLGLVEREPDPEDGRAQLLTVPSEAAARIQEVRTDVHDWLGALLDGWSLEERATFANLARRLNETPDPA
jgi:DNA-binding MarR family transcriptional regulator